MMMIRSASTNAAMAKMTHSRMSWNHTMSSITGVADPCRPISQGEGWPSPANATPGISRAAATAAIRIDRKRAGIVVSAPWMAAARARQRLRLRQGRRNKVHYLTFLSAAEDHRGTLLLGGAAAGKPGPHEPQFRPTRNVPDRMNR